MRGLVVQIHRYLRKIKSVRYSVPGQAVDDRDPSLTKATSTANRPAKLSSIPISAEFSDIAIFNNDLEGTLTGWSKGAQRMYGYTAEEAIGKPIAMLVPDNHADEIPAILNKVAHGQHIDHRETFGITKAGHLLELSFTVWPVRSTDGNIVGASTIARDITARKRAERALRESEAQYRLLFDSSPLPTWVFDRKSLAFLAVNDAAVRQYGFSREEFADMTILDIRPDADIRRLRDHLSRSMADVEDIGVWRHRKKDGSIIHVEVTSHRLEFEGREAVLVIAQDITKRKIDEERLRQSEERFSKAFRSSPFGITIATESEGRIVDANAAFLKTVGYNREEVIGRTAKDLNLWSDAQRLDLIRQQSANEDPGRLFETSFTARSGEIRQVQFAIERIRLHDEPCILAIIQDVTKAMKLEQQLRQAQKMEAMGRLAGGVSHDFNNLLTVIIGFCELSQTQLDLEHPVSKHVDQIKKAGQRAATLTRQLLAFSRQQVLHPRTLNLNEVVNSVSKMLGRLIGEDISLVLKLTEPLSSVRVDLGQMEQVLMNLVVNARDAMPEGGSIIIETADFKLDEGYSQLREVVKPGPYIMLSVSDTGVGMDSATLSRIFEPFFTTKEASRGTGLGLSTVYGIVEQSGGYIWVYSELFRGTTVKIYLPAVDQAAESLLPTTTKVTLPTGTETILLVEDNEAVREVTIGLLQSSGYKVLEAETAGSAIEISQRFEGDIDLLLSDVIMPGKSGSDLALEIKRYRPNIKLLYSSGYTGDIIAHQGVLDPGTTLVSKPFSKETLLITVRAVLDESIPAPPSIDSLYRAIGPGLVTNGVEPENSQLALERVRNSRQHLRFKLNVDAIVHSPTQGLVPANTLDISESGVSAILPVELLSGEVVDLDFKLPIRRVRVVAVVRESYKFRYGFEFVKPDEATLRTIRESCALLEQVDS